MGTDGTASLDQYLKPLTDHRKMIGVIALVVTAIGLLAGLLSPKTYEATTVVLVAPVSSDPSETVTSDSEVDVETELRLVTSNAVITRASQRLAGQSISVSPSDLESSVTASNPSNSRIIDVSMRSSSADGARLGANAVAESYIEYRAELAEEATRSAKDALSQQVADLQAELAVVESTRASSENGSEAFITASIERSAISRDLDAQQAALASLNTISSNVGRVVDPAQAADRPVGLGFVPILVGSLVGGLALGCMAAFAVAAIRAARNSNTASDYTASSGNDMSIHRLERSTKQAEPSLSPSATAAETSEQLEIERAATEQLAVPDALLPKGASSGVGPTSTTDSDASLSARDQLTRQVGRQQPTEADTRSDNSQGPGSGMQTVSGDPGGVSRDAGAPARFAPAATVDTARRQPSVEPRPTALSTDPQPHPFPGPQANTQLARPVPPQPQFQRPAATPPVAMSPQSPVAATQQPNAQPLHAPQPAHPSAAAPVQAAPSTANHMTFGAAQGSTDQAISAPSSTVMSIDEALGAPQPAARPQSGPLGVPTPASGDQRRTRRSDAADLVAQPDYTTLLSTLRRLGQDGPVACVTVGHNGREGSLAVGLGLGEALHVSGASVLVVDMMVDEPVLHHLVGLPSGPGLTDVLSGQVSLADAVTSPDGMGGLKALTSGDRAVDAVANLALLNPTAIADLLRQASALAHAVVFLGGNIDDVARHDDVLSGVGGLVLGTDEPAGAALDSDLAGRLEHLSAPVLGMVAIEAALSNSDRQAGAASPAHNF